MKRIPARLAAATALLLCLSATVARAQLLPPVEELGLLVVRVGSGVLVTLPTDVERVALADESIARPQVISSLEVLLTGLKAGRTTVFFWLIDGQRLRYLLQVERDLEPIYRALGDLDPLILIEASADGKTVLLRGEVADRRTAREAAARAKSLLGDQVRVLDLLRYPGYAITDEERLEERLSAVLREIDPRIRLRRIQVGAEPDPAQDTYVLEGRVRDIQALKKAVTVAERQLGGSGSELKAAGDERLQFQRFRGFFGSSGGGGGGAGGALQGNQPPPAGISAKVARGLVVTSESGRVVSFLEIDDVPQVMVSIRVVELNRTKARKAGINWRFDNEHVSFGSFLSPGVNALPSAAGGPVSNAAARTPRPNVVRDGPTISGVGTNLVGAYIDKVSSVLAAIDFLEDKSLARAVAEPNVLTLSGEPATVVVGGEVPIPSTAVGQVTTVQGFFFQDFGVRLDIRPTVVEDGLIALEASPSIVRRSIAIGVGDVPGFQIQSVQTTARVQAGESLVLGGLLSFEEGLEERKIPGLGWLPGIGRWRRKTRDERELLFVISPRLVETPRSAAPPEPVVMPDLDALEVPELAWPEDRDSWREDFDPPGLRPDGVPPEFFPEETEEEWAPAPVEPEYYYYPATAAQGDEPELLWEEEAPEPEPAPAPLPAVQLAAVDADPCLNLRPEPGKWSPPLDCIDQDTLVEILGATQDWTRVRLPDGREGWMAGDLLAPVVVDDEQLEEQLRMIQQEIERIRAEGAGGQ